ncbi:hypothetical protein NDQ85_15295, partial [Enterococcus faecium]|nr:hypothetical protein [Enterococcus faecium]
AEFADLYLKDTGVLIGTNSKVYQEVKEKMKINSILPDEINPKIVKKKPIKPLLLEILTQQTF